MSNKFTLATALLIPVLLSGCGVEVVETGEVGIKTTFGKPNPEPYTEGLYFINPFTSSIITLTYREQRLDNETIAYTKDVQQAGIKYALNFSLNPHKAVEVYQNVGYDWVNVLIPQVVMGSIKNTVGGWNAVDLISNRVKVANEIQNSITTALARRNITVTKFELTNIDFSNEFEKAVEEKVVAAQEAEKAKNTTVTIEEQAKQRIISAEAEAKSMQIRTQALSQNQALVMYEAVQKWNGVLPTYVTGDSANLLLQMNK